MAAIVKSFASALACVLVAALTFVAAAYASTDVTYAGPKTWLPQYAASGDYDSSYWNRWWSNEMAQKSCGGVNQCWARVAFIKTDGGWTYSYTDTTVATGVVIPPGYEDYQKKPYCLNNSPLTYTAKCDGYHG